MQAIKIIRAYGYLATLRGVHTHGFDFYKNAIALAKVISSLALCIIARPHGGWWFRIYW